MLRLLITIFFRNSYDKRIQRVMLAAPRAKAIREAKKVLFVDLIDDGGHSSGNLKKFCCSQ